MSDFWDFISEPGNYVEQASQNNGEAIDWKYEDRVEYVTQEQNYTSPVQSTSNSGGGFLDWLNGATKTFTEAVKAVGNAAGAINNADNEFKNSAGMNVTAPKGTVVKKAISPLMLGLLIGGGILAFNHFGKKG